MRRSVIAFILAAALAGPVSAQSYLYGTGNNPLNHYVNAYTTRQGTYVAPHYQTNPNRTDIDNYGTRGNFNPYSGAFGTRVPRGW